MQRTRLSTLTDVAGNRLNQLFSNPWRRIALILLGLFFGISVGQAVSTTTGQSGYWDVTVAAVMLLFTETVSRIAYRRRQNAQMRARQGESPKGSLWLDVLNVFKMGVAYSLYLEAFKLGS